VSPSLCAVAGLAAATTSLCACWVSLNGLEGSAPRTDGGVHDGGGGLDTATHEASLDAAADVSDARAKDAHDAPCAANLETDPMNCGACGHDCLGGGCNKGACMPITLSEGELTPSAIALDATQVYWTNSGTLTMSYQDGALRACPKGGGDGGVVTLAPSQNDPLGLGVATGSVFWANYGAGTLMTCTLPGCAATTMASSQAGPWPVAVNGTSVFWGDTNGGTIFECAQSACAPTQLSAEQDVPYAIAVGSTGVYWTDYGSSGTAEGTVMRCPLAGCSGGATVIAAGLFEPAGIAVDATSVYFANEGGGNIMKCPLAGCAGDPTVLVSERANPFAVAVDATDIYWVESTDSGGVLRCPLDGCGAGGPVTMASDQESPWAIAVDDVAVYWVDDGPSDSAGSVLKIAK
jgi:hypothetical protein